MAELRDITGMKFGKLIVKDRAVGYKKWRAYWNCICDCGGSNIVGTQELISGRIASCGCSRSKSYRGELAAVDSTYDRLTVVSNYDKSAYGVRRLLCKCICGNETVVDNYSLLRGIVRSCGCLEKDVNVRWRKHGRIYNGIVSKMKRFCDRKEYKYDLSHEDVKLLLAGCCHYCGCEPSTIRRSYYNKDDEYLPSNGIDRVDSNIGYVKSNVVSCCPDCNKAKNNMSTDKFREWITRIYNNYINNE